MARYTNAAGQLRESQETCRREREERWWGTSSAELTFILDSSLDMDGNPEYVADEDEAFDGFEGQREYTTVYMCEGTRTKGSKPVVLCTVVPRIVPRGAVLGLFPPNWA